jgi:von Willebrand factor A domain-containing protein 7
MPMRNRIGAFVVLLVFTAPLAAQDGQQQSRPFAPGSCGRVDPAYISTAEATGGQPMFLQPSEIAVAGHLMRSSVSSSNDAVLYAAAHLGGQKRSYTVPIDTTVKSVTLTISFDAPGTKMTLMTPTGSAVVSGGGVEISEWTCGRIVTVDSPEKGAWRIELTGTGRFWLRAEVKSELYLLTAGFMYLGGRPGHEGYFRIAGQPLVGRPQLLRVTVSGALQSTEFRLVSASGGTIQPVNLQDAGSSGDDHEYMGTVTLPPQPFRVAVSGRDENGLAFERWYLPQFHATTVQIQAPDIPDEVAVGSTVNLEFTLNNFGASDTFQIIAVDSTGTILQAQPPQLTISQSGSAKVIVPLNIAADKPVGTSVMVTITATSASNPEISNGISQEISVAGRKAL